MIFPQVLSEQTPCETLLLCNTVEVFLNLNLNYFDKTRDIQRNYPCFANKPYTDTAHLLSALRSDEDIFSICVSAEVKRLQDEPWD